MRFESEVCYRCPKATNGIYVRVKKDGVWDAQPICDDCYAKDYPGRTPCRLVKD